VAPLVSSALVGIGGFAGSIARYGLSVYCQRFGVEWPFGTIGANILGCLVIGIIAALSEHTGILSPGTRLLLATGFCGGFTTMSSMIYETAQMLRTGDWIHAMYYLLITFVCCMIAFFCGYLCVRMVIRYGGNLWS
jgi:fluoride exporter